MHITYEINDFGQTQFQISGVHAGHYLDLIFFLWFYRPFTT
jgi:hypothetical protein